MIKIRQIVWDKWNKEHIKKHKIEEEEVEDACRQVLKSFRTYGGRILILGKTSKGRFLTIVLAREKEGGYYVVTARDMGKKERRLVK